MGFRTGDGVLVLAHGTVRNLGDIPAFLARIRGGRPASPALAEETRRRYELIGGSPLLEVTRAQAVALGTRLDLPVFVGMRLWDPPIDGEIERARALGVRRLCVLPLAPYSVHVYARAAEQAVERAVGGPELVPVPPFGADAVLVEAHATAIRRVLGTAPPSARLILTAHSLPLVALRSGDPYERLVRESAAAVAERVGRPLELAFQSQGADGGEWLGPTLRAALERARDDGAGHVVVAPIGFLSEHVETLYDLDHEARAWAIELGLGFDRVPALGAAAGLIDALENVVRRTLV